MNRAAEFNRMTRRLASIGADISHLDTKVHLGTPEEMTDEELLQWNRALEGTIDTRSPLMSKATITEEYGMTVSEIERRGLLPEETSERVGRMDALVEPWIEKTAADDLSHLADALRSHLQGGQHDVGYSPEWSDERVIEEHEKDHGVPLPDAHHVSPLPRRNDG